MSYMKPGSEPPKTGRGSRLTALQLRFVEEYCDIDPKDPSKAMNGSKAVLRAGYKTPERNANRIATDLLRHPLVSAEIKRRLEAREERLELTRDYIINKLVEKVEREGAKDADQIRALELLGKTMALFKDRQEISGPDGEAIEYAQKTAEKADEFTRKLQQLAKRSNTDNVVPLQKEA